MPSDKDIHISITTGTMVKALFVIAMAITLFYLRDLVLIVLAAVVIASAIEPAAIWFKRQGVSRVLGVLAVYLMVALIVFGFVFFFAPPMLRDVSRLSVELPQYLETFKGNPFFETGVGSLPISEQLSGVLSLKQMLGSFQTTLLGFSQGFFQTFSIVFGGAFSFVLIVVLSFYLAVQDRGIENFLRVIVPLRHEEYVINLWKRSQQKIGKWFQGQLLLGLLMAILVFLGLTIFGVPYALVLALLAGVAEIIPIFGPIIAAVPAAVFAFLQSPTLGIIVIALYIILQQFENHLFVPLVITKIVGIPPLLVILSLIIGGKMAGFLGIIIAVPVASVLAELFYEFERHKRPPVVS